MIGTLGNGGQCGVVSAGSGAVAMPMTPDQTPGASEYSHGPGMFPHPKVDYTRGGKAPIVDPSPTLQDQLLDMLTYKRLDASDPDAKQEFEGPDSWGNTDRFGPGKAPVQTPGVTLGPTKVPEEKVRMKRAE